jgi:hypothetical protein
MDLVGRLGIEPRTQGPESAVTLVYPAGLVTAGCEATSNPHCTMSYRAELWGFRQARGRSKWPGRTTGDSHVIGCAMVLLHGRPVSIEADDHANRVRRLRLSDPEPRRAEGQSPGGGV